MRFGAVTLKLVGVVAILLAGAVSVQAHGGDDKPVQQGRHEIGVFNLEHVGIEDAVTVLRAIFQARQVATIADRRILITADDAASLEKAGELLREIDVPPIRWSMELVVEGRGKQKVLRKLDLTTNETKFNVRSRSGGTGATLHPRDLGPQQAVVAYRVDVHFDFDPSHEGPEFAFGEGGEARVQDGDQLMLFVATGDGMAEALADIFGVDGEVDSVYLRFRREG